MKTQISQPLSPISSKEMEIINKHLIYPMPKPSFTVIPRTPSPPRPEPVPPLITMIVTPPRSSFETENITPNIFQQIQQCMIDLFGDDNTNQTVTGDSNEMLSSPQIDQHLRRNNKNTSSPPVIITPERALTPEPISLKTKSRANKTTKTTKQPSKKERTSQQDQFPVKKAAPARSNKKKEKTKSRNKEQIKKHTSTTIKKNTATKHTKMSLPVSIPLLLLVPPEKRNRRSNRLLMPRPGGGLQWITITK